MRKGEVKFDVRGKGECVRTVPVTVVGCHFLANRNWFDHSESDIAALTKEFAVVVAVVLSLFGKKRGKGKERG